MEESRVGAMFLEPDVPLHSLKMKKKKAVCSTALSYVPEVLYIPE